MGHLFSLNFKNWNVVCCYCDWLNVKCYQASFRERERDTHIHTHKHTHTHTCCCDSFILSIMVNVLKFQTLFMPPTSKKLEGHIASGLFVRPSVHPSRFLMHSITLEP